MTLYLKKLTVSNFRKLKNSEFKFIPGLNIIVGANNIGKTALVDALRSLLAGHEDPYPRLSTDDIHRPLDGAPPEVSTNNEHGAYYAVYEPKNHKKLVESFENKLKSSGLSASNSAILYRGNSGIEKLQVVSKNLGQGKIKLLVLAAIQRDANSDFQKAFKLVVSCVIGLLDKTPENLTSMIINPDRFTDVRDIRQDIWLFVRSIDDGLPSASLKGSTNWHGLVKTRLTKLLDSIEEKYGFPKVNNLGNKLSKKGLVDEPLIPDYELALAEKLTIRIDTVHQAKGENLDAVLYMATKSHIDAMLNGVGTEVGRIGYVAVTRAKSLFILGVPKNALAVLAPKLQAIGLKEL